MPDAVHARASRIVDFGDEAAHFGRSDVQCGDCIFSEPWRHIFPYMRRFHPSAIVTDNIGNGAWYFCDKNTLICVAAQGYLLRKTSHFTACGNLCRHVFQSTIGNRRF